MQRPEIHRSSLLGSLLLLALAACGGGSTPGDAGDTADTLTRERVAHWFSQAQL